MRGTQRWEEHVERRTKQSGGKDSEEPVSCSVQCGMQRRGLIGVSGAEGSY